MSERQMTKVPPRPQVSCVVPVYNVEKYLCRSVDSVLSQTFTDFELILVDDGSTDGSGKICDEYTEKDSRVKVIHKENGGPASARNAGMEKASGAFLYFCDSDDWLDPDMLLTLVKKQKESGADIVGCDIIWEHKNYRKIQDVPMPENPRDCLKALLEARIPGYLPIKLIRRSLFENDGCKWVLGINVCEDFLICTKLFYYAQKVAYANRPLYHYNRCNESSLTFRLNENKITQILRADDEAEKFLKEKGEELFYADSLRHLKAFSKIWILGDCEKVRAEYFELFKGERLSSLKNVPLRHHIVLWLCDMRLFCLVKLVLFVRKQAKVSAGID